MSYREDSKDSFEESKFGESKCEHSRDFGKSDAKGDTNSVDDDTLIDRMQEYFYQDDSLSREFENFVNSRAHLIDIEHVDDSSEFKLEYTSLYEDFKELFERKLEGYIVNGLGCSVSHFYSVLKAKVDSEPDGMEALFAQILVAVADFNVFMVMMKEAAYSQKFNKK